jgi:hypothetical protein
VEFARDPVYVTTVQVWKGQWWEGELRDVGLGAIVAALAYSSDAIVDRA